MKRIKLSPVSAGDQNEQNAREMKPSVTRELNPLTIDLVLETLFSYCPANTLKNCRLVNKQWKDISLRFWRDKAIFCPAKNKNPEGLPNIQGYAKLLKSKLHKDKALQLQRYPFRNFLFKTSLKIDYLMDVSKPVSDIARRIILRRTCQPRYLHKLIECLWKSPSLEILEMENCDWKSTGMEEPESSKLKSLRVSRNSGAKVYEFEDWEVIFKCFNELETLSIEYRQKTGVSFGISKILSCLRNVKRAAKDMGETVIPLKELLIVNVHEVMHWNFLNRFNNAPIVKNVDMHIISPILECQFPLKRLTIHVVWDQHALEADVLPIFKLLNSCKDTLQYLNTSFNFNVSQETLRLHLENQKKKMDQYELRMEALKEVRLSNGIWGLNILAGLDLPKLEKLVIDNKEGKTVITAKKQLQLPFPEARVYGRLKTLEFLDNRKIPGPNTIRAFAKIMPNLVYLKMPLDKYTFGIVCDRFKGLKTLNALPARCRYEALVDYSFAGFSKGTAFKDSGKSDSIYLTLTDLNMTCETQLLGNVPSTDHAVIYALSQLPHLQYLTVDSKLVQLSDDDKAALLNHVSKGNVTFVSIEGKTHSILESYNDVEVELTSSMIMIN